MRLLTVLLTLLLILSACAPAAGSPSETMQVEPADVVPEPRDPVLNGTFETSLLVTVWKGKPEGNLLFLLDPASGSALSDYTPIALGQSFSHAFSPDRRTLAAVSFPAESTYNGRLLLIDLPAWQTQRFELELSGWASTMAFSPDGRQLAIAHGESSYTLTMVNVEQGVITAQVPMDSFVTRMKFTESGKALMFYSQAINATNGLSTDPPQVRLLDAADLSLLWSAELNGVRDGVFPTDETVTAANLYEPGQALYLSPGVVFAPDQDALYIVHADSEQLTTADFSAQKISTVEIEAQLNWFERLLSLTAGTAHAKIANGTSKQAVIAPDGQFLYVVGVNNASFKDKLGNLQMEQTPLGLEIIRTGDGSRVERFETESTELSLSPDGRFLYLRNWGENEPGTEIYETSNREIVTRQARTFATPALLMNGEFVLASTYSTSETSHHMSVLQADGSSVLADWTDSESVWWLTAP